MPTFYNYALNDMEESQINDAKRRVTGYNTNQTERLSSKPEEDPTNGLIDIQLSRLTDEIYLAGKEINNLDSYLQIDTALIVMNAGVPSSIKKTIQDSVKIYISINQSVEKIRRTYRSLSKNIKFASLHIWTDFTGAVEIMFKQNLELNNIVEKFVNDYRAAVGQSPADIRRPDRIDEDVPPPGDGGDGGDGGDEAPAHAPAPAPAPDEEGDDPTDPESEPSFDARTIEDEEERQDIEGVDTALPPVQDLSPSSSITLSRPTLSRPRPFIPELPLATEEQVALLADKYNFDLDLARQLVMRNSARREDKDLESEDISSGAMLDRPQTSRRPRASYEPFLTPDKIKEKIKDLTKKEDILFERFGEMFSEEDELLPGQSQKMANLIEKQVSSIQDEIIRLKALLIPPKLPPGQPLPPPSRKPITLLTQFPLRTDPVPQPPLPSVRGVEEEDVDYADTWPDLVEETSRTDVWPTIAGMAEDALTMDDVEDMPFWPDIEDQEGFTRRFLANKQTRSLGKIVGAATEAYAAAWKTLAGSRSPRNFAEFLGKAKNKQMKFLVNREPPVGKRNIIRI